MRVHELAKEFGMSSQELLDHLAELKIPAKNHASTLVEAYVDRIRKQLAPVIAEHLAIVEAERAKAEEQRLAAEAEEAAKREAERGAREAERKAAEEAARIAAEARTK
ncbi:MAG: translation initiation factor IF-2 N-terminal domain-containing protein, partial [Actinomycetia bacterium]|nr:translation initiation factor IF-2 N-terminal domain-containing protein [Actinomycetes bacterium]